MYNFDGTDEYLDSRDIVARIDDLVSDFMIATEAEDAPSLDGLMSVDDWAFGLSDDDAEELVRLIDFREAYDGQFGDSFDDGITFVHEEYFENYTKELCEDIGDIPDNLPDYIVIDWAETAENIREDYTEAVLKGTTYWAR